MFSNYPRYGCPFVYRRQRHNMSVEYEPSSFPKKAGVYLFKTKQGRVLYVGKATVLSQRIRSYFASNPDRTMIPELVKKADEIECMVTFWRRIRLRGRTYSTQFLRASPGHQDEKT